MCEVKVWPMSFNRSFSVLDEFSWRDSKFVLQTVNPDKGAFQLSHIWETVLIKSNCRWRCGLTAPSRKQCQNLFKSSNQSNITFVAGLIRDSQRRTDCLTEVWTPVQKRNKFTNKLQRCG